MRKIVCSRRRLLRLKRAHPRTSPEPDKGSYFPEFLRRGGRQGAAAEDRPDRARTGVSSAGTVPGSHRSASWLLAEVLAGCAPRSPGVAAEPVGPARAPAPPVAAVPDERTPAVVPEGPLPLELELVAWDGGKRELLGRGLAHHCAVVRYERVDGDPELEALAGCGCSLEYADVARTRTASTRARASAPWPVHDPTRFPATRTYRGGKPTRSIASASSTPPRTAPGRASACRARRSGSSPRGAPKAAASPGGRPRRSAGTAGTGARPVRWGASRRAIVRSGSTASPAT